MLTDAAEAGDDDPGWRRRPRGAAALGQAAPGALAALSQQAAEPRQHRRDEQRQADHQRGRCARRRREHARADGVGDHDEGELAALPEQQAALGRTAPRQRAGAQHQGRDGALDQHQGGDGAGHRPRRRERQAQVDGHAHRHEEQAHKQAPERFHHPFDFVPEFGFGQQQAGDQGAQRHRHPGRGRQGGETEGREQDERHEGVRLVGAREDAKQRMHDLAARQPDHGQPQRRLGDGAGCLHGEPGAVRAGAGRQRSGQDQQRRHGQVLQHQDGEHGLAERGAGHVLLAQELHDDGGGRQREREAQDRRGGAGQAAGEQRGAERARRERDLGAAGAEHPAPHRPQAARREFEPDREHQEQHANLGQQGHARPGRKRERGQPGRRAGQRPGGERPEQDADREEAEHLVDAQALQGRHEDARQDQEQQYLAQKRKSGGVVHGRSFDGRQGGWRLRF
ncbi:hypothetical protein ABIB38_001321 [Massilia sp. UYP11]